MEKSKINKERGMGGLWSTCKAVDIDQGKHTLLDLPAVRTDECEASLTFRLQLVIQSDGTCMWVPEERYLAERTPDGQFYCMREITQKLRSNQRAIITGIYMPLAQNEVQQVGTVEFHIRNVFDVPPIKRSQTGSEHTDVTGKMTLLIPEGQRDAIQSDRRVIYEINPDDLPVLRYAGQEDALLKVRSRGLFPQSPTQAALKMAEALEEGDDGEDELLSLQQQNGAEEDEDSYELFKLDDTLVEYVQNNREALQPKAATEFTMFKPPGRGGETFVRASKAFLARVRGFFRNDVFPRLRYTRFDTALMDLHIPPKTQKRLLQQYENTQPVVLPSVFIVLRIKYLKITVGAI